MNLTSIWLGPPYSLRTRLLAGVVSLSAIVLVLIATALYSQQRSFQLDRLDQQARAAIDPLRRALGGQGFPIRPLPDASAPSPPGRGRPGAGAPLPNGVFGQTRDPQGNVVRSAFLGYDRQTPSPPQLPQSIEPGEAMTVRAISGDERYRVFAAAGPDGRLTIAAVPLSATGQQLRRLLAAIVLLVLAGLALVALLGAWVIRVALRPLDAIGATAGEIATGNLSQRVEPDDRRTEVGRLGASLNAMLARIEDAFASQRAGEERLRRFLADASHELRTPLASIRGYAEVHRIGGARGPGETERAMSRIEAEAKRMGLLVENLLTLARLDERRRPPHVPVSISEIAREARDAAVAAAGDDRSLTLTAGADAAAATVDGDHDELRRVVDNLLSNAIAHTPPRTAIEISLAVGEDDSTLLLSVRDHGPGLPEGDSARLFERFWRAAGGRERGPAGAGLGLAIVAEIVAAHGGSVSARPAAGGGAEFVVELPLSASAGDL